MEPVTDHWCQTCPTPESFLDGDMEWGQGLGIFGPACDTVLDHNAILARIMLNIPLVPAASCHGCLCLSWHSWGQVASQPPHSNAGTAVTLKADKCLPLICLIRAW